MKIRLLIIQEEEWLIKVVQEGRIAHDFSSFNKKKFDLVSRSILQECIELIGLFSLALRDL